MSDDFKREFDEFQTEQEKIEKQSEEINNLQRELISKEKSLKKKIKEQKKQKGRLLKLSNGDKSANEYIKEKVSLISQIDYQLLNPGSAFVKLFLGHVNSIVIVGDETRRNEFKKEYEDFKYSRTLFSIPATLIFGFMFQSRAFDTIFQLYLTYFYLTLALRENILKVNGSNIKSWWINHHYISILTVLTICTWPATPLYMSFRFYFYAYAAYASILQILQYRYQMQRLYVLKSLGKAKAMDVANSDSAQIVLYKSFAILIPFIFGGHAMQAYNAYFLLKDSSPDLTEWQGYFVGLGFLVLAIGNFYATIQVIYRKMLRNKRKMN